VKLKSLDGGRPVALGRGGRELDEAQRSAVKVLSQSGFQGWAVYEFDRAWLGTSNTLPGDVVKESIRTLYDWIGGSASPTRLRARSADSEKRVAVRQARAAAMAHSALRTLKEPGSATRNTRPSTVNDAPLASLDVRHVNSVALVDEVHVAAREAARRG
jgi:hypothetical protein